MEHTGVVAGQPADRVPAGGMSLRELYCEHYRCPAAEFEQRLLRQCLHSPLLAGLIQKFDRDFFQPDLKLMQALGQMQNFPDFHHEVESNRQANPPRGLFRRQLKVRVSGRLLLKVAAKLFLKTNLTPRPSSR